jgi:hypothetical protein
MRGEGEMERARAAGLTTGIGQRYCTRVGAWRLLNSPRAGKFPYECRRAVLSELVTSFLYMLSFGPEVVPFPICRICKITTRVNRQVSTWGLRYFSSGLLEKGVRWAPSASKGPGSILPPADPPRPGPAETASPDLPASALRSPQPARQPPGLHAYDSPPGPFCPRPPFIDLVVEWCLVVLDGLGLGPMHSRASVCSCVLPLPPYHDQAGLVERLQNRSLVGCYTRCPVRIADIPQL